ncbi:uncharacterized protein C8A04DRAFT_32948 [Dichotomopilus funicola]|uniref:F-box domain-containing protein n=1 Tax=Dichotomopilus funicola TaxID=1934379 RepID=A0AAN6UVZ4_9PEZI|nr:hypothetical protein C8A04DRAFT_32948 [Dichotomopilus funicola]
MALLPGFTLPVELCGDVVRSLDPISLIALSQTSRSWRALIQPTRRDFQQRLLALELTPEHGGIVPRFDLDIQASIPAYTSDAWEANKYACCGCMKLRTHMLFNNHAILRESYRKPTPDCVEATRMAVTEWEPLDPAARWVRIQERTAKMFEERARRVQAARQHRAAVAQNAANHPFVLVTVPDNGSEARLRQWSVGISRLKRRCIDCLRQRSRSAKEIVISRDIFIPAFQDQTYPDLIGRTSSHDSPKAWRAVAESTTIRHVNLYVIYCKSCQIWQLSGAFRTSMLRHGSHNVPLDGVDLVCNHCHLRIHNDVDLLAKELTDHAMSELAVHIGKIEYQLLFGWRLVRQGWYYQNHQDPPPPGEKEADGLPDYLAGLGFDKSGEARLDVGSDVPDARIPELRRRFDLYKEFLDGLAESDRAVLMSSWFGLWIEEYDLIEAMYLHLHQQHVWLKNNPRGVFDYVFKRDPHWIHGPKRPYPLLREDQEL